MDATLNINFVPKDEIKVYYGTGAHVDNNASVFFIKSGQKEIDDYVDAVSKPEIDDYVKLETKPIVSQIVHDIAEPIVAEYIENTVKPGINDYVDGQKPELQTFVVQAQQYADYAQSYATESETHADDALASLNASQTSAANAKESETNALNSKSAAASSATSASNYANNSKIWAEGSDSQVQTLGGTHSAKVWADQASLASDGKADIDLSNLSATGLAKFNAKQNTITGAATTIVSANLTANRALISNGSGKVAVSAVTNTELGYLDGVTSAIQTQLNSKISTRLGNVDATDKETIVGWGMPNYGVIVETASGYTTEWHCVGIFSAGVVTLGGQTITCGNSPILILKGKSLVFSGTCVLYPLAYKSGVASKYHVNVGAPYTATQNGWLKIRLNRPDAWGTAYAYINGTQVFSYYGRATTSEYTKVAISAGQQYTTAGVYDNPAENTIFYNYNF